MKYVLVSFFILILGLLGFLNPLREVALGIFSPVQFGLNKSALSLKQQSEFFSNVNKVRTENLQLLNKTKMQEEEIAKLKQMQTENELLRQQLGLKDKFGNYDTKIMATVMGNAEDLSGSTVLINKGTKDGVRVNDMVVIGNSLVGITRTVGYGRSQVELITSSNLSFTAYDIDSPSKSEGLAKGQHGSSVILERILQNEKIAIGDVIVTSGKDGIFIPNLIVGKVTDLQDDPSQPLKKATVQTSVDFSKMLQVFVLQNRGQ